MPKKFGTLNIVYTDPDGTQTATFMRVEAPLCDGAPIPPRSPSELR